MPLSESLGKPRAQSRSGHPDYVFLGNLATIHECSFQGGHYAAISDVESPTGNSYANCSFSGFQSVSEIDYERFFVNKFSTSTLTSQSAVQAGNPVTKAAVKPVTAAPFVFNMVSGANVHDCSITDCEFGAVYDQNSATGNNFTNCGFQGCTRVFVILNESFFLNKFTTSPLAQPTPVPAASAQ